MARGVNALGVAVAAALDRAADRLLREPERLDRLIAETVETSLEASIRETVSALVRERVEVAVRGAVKGAAVRRR